jgi:hypothetical protein
VWVCVWVCVFVGVGVGVGTSVSAMLMRGRVVKQPALTQ